MFVLELLVFGMLILQGRTSHLQGGSATWRVHENFGNGSVMVKTTLSYNIRTSSCPYASLTPRCYLTPDGATPISHFTSFDHSCGDNSSEQYWTTTQLVQYAVHKSTDACFMRIYSVAWIGGLSGYTRSANSILSLPYFVDLRVNNNGKVNSAPVAIIPPVVKFFMGCASSLLIPTMDEDGDIVSCRFAESLLEGGDVISMSYPHLTLYRNPCRLQYAGTAIQGRYPVALIVEDHPADNQTAVNSYSSLQFVVEVASAPTANFSCNEKPIFVDPTPPADQVISVSEGQAVTITLQARSSHYTYSISRFGLIGPTNLNRSDVFRVSNTNTEFSISLSWYPGEKDRGPNYFCFEAIELKGINNWIASEQRCITLVVGEERNPCAIDNGGCSDRCIQDAIGYHCECGHLCWVLLEDQRRCAPKMYRTCARGRMAITVEKCAVDGKIGIGDFDPENIDTTLAECRDYGNNTHHSFNFGLSNCGTERLERPDELVHKNTLKMWIEKSSSSVITRGDWLYIDFICSVQKYQNVSGVFDPQDTSTITIVFEEGFAEIQMAFDFYPDFNFQSPFGPADYPRQYDSDERIYFGLHAESTDTDIELFTESCTALPEPPVAGISYPMVVDGCLQDPTMLIHPASSAKRNFFSIVAFRFNDTHENIDNTTDVTISCEVVVCVQGVANTRCSRGCVNSRSGSSQSRTIWRRSIVPAKVQQVNEEEEEEGQSKPERDPSIKQTDTIPLAKSPPFTIRNRQVENLGNPENGSRGAEFQKILFAISIYVWWSLMN